MIGFMGKNCVAIGFVSEEIFFLKAGRWKKKLKLNLKYHLVVWIHMNVGSFDSLQSDK